MLEAILLYLLRCHILYRDKKNVLPHIGFYVILDDYIDDVSLYLRIIIQVQYRSLCECLCIFSLLYALIAKAQSHFCRFACEGNDLKGVYGLFSIG